MTVKFREVDLSTVRPDPELIELTRHMMTAVGLDRGPQPSESDWQALFENRSEAISDPELRYRMERSYRAAVLRQTDLHEPVDGKPQPKPRSFLDRLLRRKQAQELPNSRRRKTTIDTADLDGQ